MEINLDQQQVRILRGEWEYFYNKKETFIEKIAKRALNAEQRLEAEMYLIELTGTIKAIDAKIQAIMFGSSEVKEERAYTLEYLVGNNLKARVRELTHSNVYRQRVISDLSKELVRLQSREERLSKKLLKGKHRNQLKKAA